MADYQNKDKNATYIFDVTEPVGNPHRGRPHCQSQEKAEPVRGNPHHLKGLFLHRSLSLEVFR